MLALSLIVTLAFADAGLKPRCEGKHIKGAFDLTDGVTTIYKNSVRELVLDRDDTDFPILLVQFDEQGAAVLEQMTKKRVGKSLNARIGRYRTAPFVASRISDGRLQLRFEGDFKSFCEKPVYPKSPKKLEH